MNIVLMGNGAWGSAIGTLLKENKLDYKIWQENQKIKAGTTIIGALPTQIIRKSLSFVDVSDDITYINCSKGIEQETYMLPYQIVTDVLGKNIDYFTLLGPSFSDEVKKHMPTLVNLGYRNEAKAQEVKHLFQTDYFRIKLSNSIRALEFSGAFKNVYAIACGIAQGLGFKMNTRVKLMIIAMYELNALIYKLGYKIDANSLPATAGDLILTCNSNESRNFTFGTLLVKSDPETALHKVGQTVEGYFNAKSIPYFENKTGLSLPLARFVYETLYEDSKNIRRKFETFVKNT